MQITPRQKCNRVRTNEKTVLFPRDDFALEAFHKNPAVESKRRCVVLRYSLENSRHVNFKSDEAAGKGSDETLEGRLKRTSFSLSREQQPR